MTKNYRIYLRSEISGIWAWILALDLVLDLVLDPEAGPGPQWSQDRSLRILYLRYTGFKASLLTSRNLSLGCPRIGYARLVVARNVSNQSQGMDYNSVITLGKPSKQPLMCSASELADGLEPHDHI